MSSSGQFDAVGGGRRSWIFQANPQIFDLAEALKHLKAFRWSVRQYSREIRAGDNVYLWISGSNGGLVAKGQITTDPEIMEERPEERSFNANPEDSTAELRAELEVSHRVQPPVPRSVLVRHPALSGISLIRAPQGTNFPLTPDEARALDELCRPRPTFRDLMERYRQEGTVFQSSERAALYCITSVDDAACDVTRLTASEPDRCSLGGYEKKLAMVRDNGGSFPFLNLDATAAKRTTYLQGLELGLSPDGKDVLDLGDEDLAQDNFVRHLASLNVDRSSGQPRLYKPAMVACVIEAVLQGDLINNRVPFEWVLPRFLDKLKAVGQEGGAQQAAYAYYSLTSELFWMLCYHDPVQFIPNVSDASPSSLRERVRHAVIKHTYWRLLADTDRCKALLKSLADSWWPQAHGANPDDPLLDAFRAFQQDPACRLYVKVRRTRASEIRELIRHPEAVSLEQFHRDIWNGETSTLLDGQEIKGQLFGQITLEPERLRAVERALDEGRLELHGNFVWNQGSRIFGPTLSLSEEQKAEKVRDALRLLNDEGLAPLEKATRINAIEGFGPGTATGLTMLAHPESFAVWNQQSKGAFKKIGLESNELAAFEEAACRLKERLGADDFLELDHFLYLVNQGRIKVAGAETSTAAEKVETEPGVRYWAISLGEGGRLFKQCVQDGVIAIGWDHLGPLDRYPTREDLTKAIAEHRGDGVTPHNDSLACYQFRDEIKPGDVVFAKRGRNLILGCGRVESTYSFDPKRPEYRHTRKVSWLNQGSWTIPEDAHVPTKTLTEVTDYLKFLAFALPFLETTEPEPSTEPARRTYTIEQAIDGLFLTKDEFQRILRSLSRKKNAILQGPPGVGKSFIARRLAYALIGAEDPTKVAAVQFHQSYSYEDFIQGYRPHEQGGFDRRNGVFFEFCQRAASDPDRNSTYVFIIDEINRGNLSKIFGELFLLIEADKRGPQHAIPLTYSKGPGEVFFVPENLHLLGMMNTADRSLAMVDFALRRRFAFIDLRPAFHTLEFQSFLEGAGVEPDLIDLIKDRMAKLNEVIRSEKSSLGPGFEIGHSFFCPQETEETLDVDWYRSVIREEIAPLLREYWFDDPERAEDLTAALLA